MSVCVIVMGGDTATRLSTTIDVGQTVSSAGGSTVARCANCIQTQRVLITPPRSSTDVYTAAGVDNAELKPAEAHVLTFPLRADAQGWLDAQAEQLVGKTVFLIDPAIATS